MLNNELLTVTDIADRLNEPPLRVAYLIRKHRIKCVRQIGSTKMFGKSVVGIVKSHLWGMRIYNEGRTIFRTTDEK